MYLVILSPKKNCNQIRDTYSRLCSYFSRQFYSSLLMYATHKILLRHFPRSLTERIYALCITTETYVFVFAVSCVYTNLSCSRFLNRIDSPFLSLFALALNHNTKRTYIDSSLVFFLILFILIRLFRRR